MRRSHPRWTSRDIGSASSSIQINQFGFRPPGVKVRLFVPGKPNNWACATAQRFHHEALLDAGVRILEHPAMLHAKAFVRDGEDVLAGTCNLEAWSLKRFFEIDVLVRSSEYSRPQRSRRSRRCCD